MNYEIGEVWKKERFYIGLGRNYVCSDSSCSNSNSKVENFHKLFQNLESVKSTSYRRRKIGRLPNLLFSRELTKRI